MTPDEYHFLCVHTVKDFNIFKNGDFNLSYLLHKKV
jgi:hypothetical protein